jgi:hypothetical protein
MYDFLRGQTERTWAKTLEREWRQTETFTAAEDESGDKDDWDDEL